MSDPASAIALAMAPKVYDLINVCIGRALTKSEDVRFWEAFISAIKWPAYEEPSRRHLIQRRRHRQQLETVAGVLSEEVMARIPPKSEPSKGDQSTNDQKTDLRGLQAVVDAPPPLSLYAEPPDWRLRMAEELEDSAIAGLKGNDRVTWRGLLGDMEPSVWGWAVQVELEKRMAVDDVLRFLLARLDRRDEQETRVAVLVAIQDISRSIRNIALSLGFVAAAIAAAIKWLPK